MTTNDDPQFSAIFRNLTPTQRVYVAARARGRKVAEAAEDAGVTRHAPAKWDADLINTAILEIQQAMLADAARALAPLLPGSIDRVDKEIKRGGAVGLNAAKEVFDRVWGKPVQRNENRNYDMSSFSDDELARIAEGADPATVIRERKT